MFTTYLVSLVLLGLSGLLIDSHRRSWQAAQADTELADHERRFARAQYRRRIQASGIIGVLGLAIGVRALVPPSPWPMAIYLASLVGACACILLLALLDVWATRQQYHRLRSEQIAKQARLAMELRAAGKSSDPDG